MKFSWLTKLGLVIGGYIGVCLLASAVVYVWQLSTQGASTQSSAGMYAGGDALLFVVVFGLLALIPTGLAVYFVFNRGT